MQQFFKPFKSHLNFFFSQFQFKTTNSNTSIFYTNVFDSQLVAFLLYNCVFATVSSAWRWSCRSAVKDPCGQSWWWVTEEGSLWWVTSRLHSSMRDWPISLLRTWWGKFLVFYSRNDIVKCKWNPQKFPSLSKVFMFKFMLKDVKAHSDGWKKQTNKKIWSFS